MRLRLHLRRLHPRRHRHRPRWSSSRHHRRHLPHLRPRRLSGASAAPATEGAPGGALPPSGARRLANEVMAYRAALSSKRRHRGMDDRRRARLATAYRGFPGRTLVEFSTRSASSELAKPRSRRSACSTSPWELTRPNSSLRPVGRTSSASHSTAGESPTKPMSMPSARSGAALGVVPFHLNSAPRPPPRDLEAARPSHSSHHGDRRKPLRPCRPPGWERRAAHALRLPFLTPWQLK